MLLPETIAVHDKSAFEFHVIYFLPWKNQLVESIEQSGGVVTCFSASNNIRILLQVRKVKRYIKEHQIDLIHCHLPWAGFLGRIVHKLTGIPVLYTEHNKQERYHFLTKLLNRISFNWQTAAVAVSGEVAASVQKNIHPKVPVHKVLNGINTEKFVVERSIAERDLSFGNEESGIREKELGIRDWELGGKGNEELEIKNKKSESFVDESGKGNWIQGRRLRDELGIAEDEIVIGTIAVFRFQKRLDIWLEVVAELHRKNPKVKGIVVGDGPLKEFIHAKHKELYLEGIVFLPGLQTNTVAWLAAMDIYMMSSVYEGLPIALLEAMSSGLPVVCTNAGGTGEVIQDGVDGYLVPVEEPMGLVEPMSALAADVALRQRTGGAGRKRVIEEFGLVRMVVELQRIYKKYLMNRS